MPAHAAALIFFSFVYRRPSHREVTYNVGSCLNITNTDFTKIYIIITKIINDSDYITSTTESEKHMVKLRLYTGSADHDRDQLLQRRLLRPKRKDHRFSI